MVNTLGFTISKDTHLLIEGGGGVKKVLFAHLKEIIQFDSENEVNDYLEKQNSKYKVLSVEQKDGHFILTILKAYNRTTMLDEKEGE